MISVLVPALNEERMIERCLTALVKQQTRVPFEVVVVDNGSTDATVMVAQAWMTARDLPWRVVVEPRRGVTQALARGAAVARYDILARTDADTMVPATWVNAIAGSFADRRVAAWGGGVRYGRHGWTTAAVRSFHAWHQWLGVPYYFGANMAVRREALMLSGGYGREAWWRKDDLDLSLRLRQVFVDQAALVFDEKCVVDTSWRKYAAGVQGTGRLTAAVLGYVYLMGRYAWQEWRSVLTDAKVGNA